MISLITLLTVAGLLLSFYATYVTNKKADFPDYKPLCDISRHISCTKAFMSEYSTVFIWPNTIYGLVYFGISFIFSFNRVNYIFYISVPAVLFCLYLAYISYFRQKNLCIVCTLVYVIVVLLTVLSYMQELM
jgi:vitamin-K-epoxide reductase (warfarin-sensitive)